MRGPTLSLAAALIVGAPAFALAQAIPPNTPPPVPLIINQNGGFAGTSFGAGGAGAGKTSTTSAVTTSATPVSRARSAAMISGQAHIGAGTGGWALEWEMPLEAYRTLRSGAGSGGQNDLATKGSDTGGVTGLGTGLNASTGGIRDAFNQGIDTGGVQGAAIGAGTGGLRDLNSLGASTGGTTEGDNAPRYRVVQ